MNGNDGIDILKTLPPEDGRIDQALQELDAKLDAWAQTILATEASLKGLVSSQKAEESRDLAGEDQAQPEVTAREAQEETEVEPLAGITGLEEPEPVEVEAETEPEAAQESRLNPEESGEARAAEPAISETAALEPAVPEEPAGDAQEDEALLASLDPSLVKKIQVLRRLTSKKRSVRELLEQVKASAAEAPAPVEHKKKSFWRR